MTWSATAWKTASHVYEAILRLPFLKELADGTLPKEKFDFYIGQDSLYLDDYSGVLAHIASRVNDTQLTEVFLKFAADGVAVEKSLHASFIGNPPSEKSPTCLFYTSLLRATASDNVAVECAAILPCFWIYREVGREVIKAARMEGNPYAEWISTYADEAFSRSTDLCISICDRLAEEVTDDVRRRMTTAFLNAARLEWRFWNSAYNLETWEKALSPRQ